MTCTWLGGMTPELEIILAEGAGLQPGYTTQKVIEKRNRCKLGQVALTGSSTLHLFDALPICPNCILLKLYFFKNYSLLIFTFR